jgi:hypothetical protein
MDYYGDLFVVKQAWKVSGRGIYHYHPKFSDNQNTKVEK